MDFNWFICSYQLFSYEQKREINSSYRTEQHVIKEPDAQTQSRQTCEKSQLVGYFLENKMLKVCGKIIMGKQSKTLLLEL